MTIAIPRAEAAEESDATASEAIEPEGGQAGDEQERQAEAAIVIEDPDERLRDGLDRKFVQVLEESVHRFAPVTTRRELSIGLSVG